MQHFPNAIFAWAFVGTLLVLLAAAAVVDIRTARIPKPLTLSIAACGMFFNIVRGAWMGAEGKETWELGPGSAAWGALDGFLFSVVGLLFAFTVFFGIFLLGSCAGGDVKLCSAIGAWIGAVYTIFLLLATVGALALWIAVKIVSGGMPSLAQMQKAKREMKSRSALRQKGQKNPPAELPRGRMTFSLPAAVAAAVVMLYFFRVDLQLVQAPQGPANEANHASAAPPSP